MDRAGFFPIDSGSAPLPRPGIGILGYGSMGKVHSNAYLKAPYTCGTPTAHPRLIAMCGRNREKAEAVARSFGYEGYYTDWRKLAEDPRVEIFDNCTPDDMHAAPSIAAARGGKHVICEKPLAMSAWDSKRMVEAVKKAGVKNMCCYNYRFLPAVRLAKDLLERETLGKIYHFRARYLQEWGHDPGKVVENVWYATGTKSGVLLGIGCHVIDMARFLVGEITVVSGLVRTYNTVRRTAGGKNEKVKADEGNVALVEFSSGATGTIESSAVATGRKNQLVWEINGSRGSVAWDLEDPNHLHVYSVDVPMPEIRGFSAVSVTESFHPLHTVFLHMGHNAGWEYGHVHAIGHFLDCVVNDKPVGPYGATFDDGYRVQVVIDAIRRSSRSGVKVKVRY
jgi:predicted dehydrogenase